MDQLNTPIKIIGTLVLDKLTHRSIEKLPVKLQIYFILKFWRLCTTNEIDNLIELIKYYELTKLDCTDNEPVFKIIESYDYEVSGIFFNLSVPWTFIRNDYVRLWANLIDNCINRGQYYFNRGCCVDVHFDIIILMCEIFNISIQPKHIPQLMTLRTYNEDNAIYMLKSCNISFGNNCLSEFMRAFEIMYDDAIKREYNFLAKVIRTLPCFVAHLSNKKMVEIISNHPEILNYNFNKNPITFEILNGCNDVISVRLKNLCRNEKLKNFESTNRILSIMLANRLVVPNNELYNKTFFNYYNKINTELGNEVDYSPETNYSEELLKLHLEIMGKPIVEIQ